MEGFNEADVAGFVRHLTLAYQSRLLMVPLRDMPSILEIQQNTMAKPVQVGDWVRVKRGLYRDDLAKVLRVYESGTRVAIQLIPRIDIAALRAGM